MPAKSSQVKIARRILFLGVIFLGGCSTAHDVAVSSFRVIDAPANFVRRKIDNSDTATTTRTTTTTTTASDIATPGRHVVPNSRDQHRQVTAPTQPGPSATPRVTRNTTEKPKSSPSPAPRSVTNPPTQYPTAKAVPGKPGYVFSPYDASGGYVDVNGYPSGSKVKDPYSGKVFLVP
jgi:hypothetical protein